MALVPVSAADEAAASAARFRTFLASHPDQAQYFCAHGDYQGYRGGLAAFSTCPCRTDGFTPC